MDPVVDAVQRICIHGLHQVVVATEVRLTGTIEADISEHGVFLVGVELLPAVKGFERSDLLFVRGREACQRFCERGTKHCGDFSDEGINRVWAIEQETALKDRLSLRPNL